jgi:hypothetical protein
MAISPPSSPTATLPLDNIVDEEANMNMLIAPVRFKGFQLNHCKCFHVFFLMYAYCLVF